MYRKTPQSGSTTSAYGSSRVHEGVHASAQKKVVALKIYAVWRLTYTQKRAIFKSSQRPMRPPERMTTMWTMDNTMGFNQDQLDMINRVIDRIATGFPGVDESNINDAVNNSWGDDITENELYTAASKRLS